MYLYKLSFQDKAEFLTTLDLICEKDKEDNLIINFDYIKIGNVPIEATYDEDGRELTEASQYKDYAVDILSKVEIEGLNDFIISPKKHYYHAIAGLENMKPVIKK